MTATLAQTSVNSFPDNMAARNDAPLSDLDSSAMFGNVYQQDFAFKTESWNDQDEGYFLDTSSQAASQAGYSVVPDHTSPTASSPGLASQVSTNDLWSNDMSSHMGGEQMTRWPSQDSMAAHQQWHRKPSSASMDSFVKPMDPHLSLLSPISQAESLSSTQVLADSLYSFNDFTCSTEDDLGAPALLFSNQDVFPPLDMSSNTIHAPFPQRHTHSPPAWPVTETRKSSPSTLEDAWSNDQMSASHASSPLASASSVRGQSPRYVSDDTFDLVDSPHPSSQYSASTKPQISRASSFGANFALPTSRRSTGVSPYEQSGLVPVRRSSPVESENAARDDPLYRNAAPGPDGLYHCPWEKDGSCSHKPDKLKCNYDKFVDSHLKPYRCKVDACENARFSSTACLLRHEREAHAMHGHGDKPYLCTYEGCDRAVAGNGFPRHWNLRDHMKRMHNDSTSGSNSATAVPVPTLKGGRKRKAATTEKPAGKKSQTAATVLSPAQNTALPPHQLELWCQNRQLLEMAVQQLPQHPDAGTLQLLEDANGYLNVMRPLMQPLASADQSG